MFICVGVSVRAQTNISGVVNSYYAVTEIIPAKACVRLSTTTGLSADQRVLLIQMKGAAISTTNNASFGDTTSTNEAGYYETATVCAIRGDSVFFYQSLLNSYTVSGKLQLVKFAAYTSANIIDTLKATTWNNTTGTGGVIAVYTDADLSLQAPVYADGAGFAGGAPLFSSSTCSNVTPATGYAYNGSNSAPQSGAYKGEGIADVATTQSGGRGAPANGGGGGNNHNNSGGGGANMGAGGQGGGNSSSAGCTTTLRGMGGKALKNWSGQKIFAGGGGGAGHNNNGVLLEGGGNGGGIVFIWAGSITGNGYAIRANGKTGGNSQSDGAGGGGAGGTIIIACNSFNGALTVEAKGGKGGDSDDGGNIGRCFGGGGGGGGGAIYFTSAIPAVTTSISGGAAGNEISRDASCAAAQPAAAGADGIVTGNYSFARSLTPAGYCALLLPVQLEYFTGQVRDKQAILQWKIAVTPGITLFTIEQQIDNNWVAVCSQLPRLAQADYLCTVAGVKPGTNHYRLRITENTGAVSYSSILRLDYKPAAALVLFPNPAASQVTVYRSQATHEWLTITDLQGKELMRRFITGQTILLPTEQLQNGIYLVRTGTASARLIIQR